MRIDELRATYPRSDYSLPADTNAREDLFYTHGYLEGLMEAGSPLVAAQARAGTEALVVLSIKDSADTMAIVRDLADARLRIDRLDGGYVVRDRRGLHLGSDGKWHSKAGAIHKTLFAAISAARESAQRILDGEKHA